MKAGGEVPSAEIVEDRKSEEVANGPDGERKCATDPPQTARQTSAECTDRPQVGVEPTALVQPVAIEISLTRALRDVVKRYVDGGELEKAQKVLELLADIEGEEAKAKADNGKVVSLDAARKAGRK